MWLNGLPEHIQARVRNWAWSPYRGGCDQHIAKAFVEQVGNDTCEILQLAAASLAYLS